MNNLREELKEVKNLFHNNQVTLQTFSKLEKIIENNINDPKEKELHLLEIENFKTVFPNTSPANVKYRFDSLYLLLVKRLLDLGKIIPE